ncbi:MAG: sensor histidine kinase [Cytophagaceae bacterium]|nr:sensor histidine kinase [Cytophagaceae bacterium]
MKIKHQFVLLILLITFFIISTISILLFYYGKKMIMEETYSHLESLSATKEIRINDIVRKKIEMVNFLNNVITTHINWTEFNTDDSTESKNLFLPLQAYLYQLPSIKNIHLIDTSSKIISSMDTSHVGDYYEHKPHKRKRKGKVYIDGIHEYKGGKELVITLCSPLIFNDKRIGALIIDLDASDVISLTSDYTGLGETGETVLAKKDSVITFITPLRFNKKYNTVLKIDPKHPSAISHGFEEGNGIIRDHYDYREKLVIASTRFIKEPGWAMVTKIDEEEALKPVMNLQRMLGLFAICAFALSFIIALIAGNYFAKPIKDLTYCVKKIRDGNLALRINIKTENEIGKLSDAFNEMTLKLSRKVEELKLSNESLNKFAYVITHDLKAPALSIRALSEIIKDEYENKQLDDAGRDMLGMMISQTKHMEEMIEGVLGSAKSGYKSKDKEYINSYNLLCSVMQNLAPPASMQIIIQKDLPDVKYNKISLIQIFQNLISNSIKYMDKSPGKIEVGGVTMENKVKFFVKDNGPGIKEEDFNKIFLMFGATQKQNVESHGIGLATVKKIITENNGEIWLESKIGDGCTFYFTIPKE